MNSHIPNEFLCPISMELMEDPVLCADGQTYERRQIQEWLRQSATSPLTRQPLSVETLVPNYALKASIQRWKTAQSKSIPAVGRPAPTAPLGPPNYNTYNQYTPPTINPSYTMVAMPYTPPPMYPSYQTSAQTNQTAQSHMSIVPTQVRRETFPLQPNPAVRRILLLLCCVMFLVSIISSILYSQQTNSRKPNNDDDN